MRYPRYLLALDAFGMVGLLSALAFGLLPQHMRPAAHIDDLWGNVSSEFVGIWVAVRLIDFIIKRNEASTKGRVRTVRGMRYIEQLFFRFHRYPGPHELKNLQREYRWNEARLSKRKQHLSRDEIADVDSFYACAEQLLGLLPPTAPAGRDDISYDMAAFDTGLVELERVRRVAEDNILRETDEDSGL